MLDGCGGVGGLEYAGIVLPAVLEDGFTVSDTIFAPSSGSQRAGVCVIRVSGSGCAVVLDELVDGPCAPRVACLRVLRNEKGGFALDQCLVLWFPHPSSFTGEDVVELHVHGGRAVVDGCLRALGNLAGFRLAEPGEFARRAFSNGKLDLSEVEGLADLINAQTEAQRRLALRSADGRVRRVYEGWRDRLLGCLAHVEADVDFVDESDVPDDLSGAVTGQLQGLLDDLNSHNLDPRRGDILRDGFRVVLAGLPNVGKSSLLNALANRDAAIVTEVAGTTRDVLEVFMDLGGYPVVFCDTAGLRTSVDVVESIGIQRAVSAVTEADLVVWICDERGEWPDLSLQSTDSDAIWIRNKGDLNPIIESEPQLSKISAVVSAQSNEGIGGLLAQIEHAVSARFELTEDMGVSRQRHAECVSKCVEHISGALRIARSSGGDAELLAEELRLAARALARISGLIDVEDILDRIFGEFCIGK